MNSDPVTLGEVARRLDDVTRQLGDLITRMDSTYVRRDVFETKIGAGDIVHENLEHRIKEVSRDLDDHVKSTVAGRSKTITALVYPALVAGGSAFLAAWLATGK